MRRVRFALILCVLVLLTGPAAYAQSTPEPKESITASPSSESFKINAGDTRRGSMRIINDGDVAYDFSVYARPYSVTNELYNPTFSIIKQNTDIFRWVQFEKTQYHLAPGQTAVVNYIMTVPADAAPGGHYGVLFAETRQGTSRSTGVVRQKRVGDLIFATVNGSYKTNGKLENFVLPNWQRHVPLTSEARVTNGGNVDFEVDATTTVQTVFGADKFRYHSNPRVLPGTTRLIIMNWESAPRFGIFRVTQQVSFLGQHHSHSGVVLLAPLWFAVVAPLIILFGAGYAIRNRRARRG